MPAQAQMEIACFGRWFGVSGKHFCPETRVGGAPPSVDHFHVPPGWLIHSCPCLHKAEMGTGFWVVLISFYPSSVFLDSLAPYDHLDVMGFKEA